MFIESIYNNNIPEKFLNIYSNFINNNLKKCFVNLTYKIYLIDSYFKNKKIKKNILKILSKKQINNFMIFYNKILINYY